MKLLVCLLAVLAPGFAQNAAPAPGTAPAAQDNSAPAASKAPALSLQQQELFLQTADIVSRKVLDAGTTKSERLTLSDGRITHDAHLQCLDVFKPVFRGREGTVEKNFRDTWKFNVAAYRIARLLDLEMVPPSVERVVDGKSCSVTWWADDVWITEAERRDKQIKPPANQHWVDQLNKVRVFDQLIYNTDRNQGNLLITPSWQLWMIDHTRAFRAQPALLKPDALGRCDYKLMAAMKKLNLQTLTKQLGPYLRAEEIRTLLVRRDNIVRFFEKEIAAKGEDAVLTGMPRATPTVSVP